jgi:ornithine cyclodeaminase/alanine dehydrogenase-like protein (mu-crystallin family)
LVLNAGDVASLVTWDETIAALRAAYAGHVTDAMVPARSMARDPGVWLRSLTAVSPSGEHVGAKLITVNTANIRASYLIALIDRSTAELAALIDGNHITGLRTAATSAVFVEHAAPTRAVTVAVVGSGFEAWNHLAAVASVCSVASATVFSPTLAKREAFAARAQSELGITTTAFDDPERAVDGADVIICAARARNEEPTLHGAWLRPGATVVSIGSTLPEQREVDSDTLARADRIVADMPHEVIHQTGDFIAARAAGVVVDDKVVSLADVVGGRVVARQSEQEIVLYKSVGSALQDVVLAELMLRKARDNGIGTAIDAPIQPLIK